MENNNNQPVQSDAEQNKIYGVLAYFIFFIPLIACPNSEFGKFHANQGLNLLLACIAVGIASVILAFIPFLGWLISFAAYIALTVFAIMGIINAVNGEMKELPLIGQFKLLK